MSELLPDYLFSANGLSGYPATAVQECGQAAHECVSDVVRPVLLSMSAECGQLWWMCECGRHNARVCVRLMSVHRDPRHKSSVSKPKGSRLSLRTGPACTLRRDCTSACESVCERCRPCWSLEPCWSWKLDLDAPSLSLQSHRPSGTPCAALGPTSDYVVLARLPTAFLAFLSAGEPGPRYESSGAESSRAVPSRAELGSREAARCAGCAGARASTADEWNDLPPPRTRSPRRTFGLAAWPLWPRRAPSKARRHTTHAF